MLVAQTLLLSEIVSKTSFYVEGTYDSQHANMTKYPTFV